MNYVERHFGDWARDTVHLSMLEDGAYNRLCDLYYVREQPLPADFAGCCRLARAVTKPERDAVRSVLGEFFVETPEGWRHKRCDEEIERFRTKSGKASASARVRWAADRSQSEGNANADANASLGAMRSHAKRMPNAMPHAGADGRAPTPHSPLPSNQSPNTAHPSDAPSGDAAKPPRATRKAPPDFALTEDRQLWAQANARNVDAKLETAKFCDHTFRGAILDWDGAWRNWLRRAQEDAQQHRGRNGAAPMSTEARDREAMRILGINQPPHGTQEIIDA